MSRYRYLGAAAIVTVAQWLVILANSPSHHHPKDRIGAFAT